MWSGDSGVTSCLYGSMTHLIPYVDINVAKIDYKYSAWDHVFCLDVSLLGT